MDALALDDFVLYFFSNFMLIGWLIFAFFNIFLVIYWGTKNTIRNPFSALIFIAQILSFLVTLAIAIDMQMGLGLFHVTESIILLPFYATMIGIWSFSLNLTHLVSQRKKARTGLK